MSQEQTCFSLAELEDSSTFKQSITILQEMSLQEHVDAGKTNVGYNSFEDAMTDINSYSKKTTHEEYSSIMANCI